VVCSSIVARLAILIGHSKVDQKELRAREGKEEEKKVKNIHTLWGFVYSDEL
jgi:hypothetical protein